MSAPSPSTRVKICCIASIEEAWAAIEGGASAIGLVSEMPSGPGPIPEARIAEVAAAVPPGVARFLLTSRLGAEAILDQQRRCGTDTLQLVDRVEPAVHRELRAALPGVSIVQVIHVRGQEALEEARVLEGRVDALLLDSGNPNAEVKELGGTGRTHDWDLSRRIREAVRLPVWLAGGLRPDNVAEAITRVRPFGVDLCSGVRTGGQLDLTKLGRFFAAVRSTVAP